MFTSMSNKRQHTSITSFCCTVGHKSNIISIHNARDPQPEGGSCRQFQRGSGGRAKILAELAVVINMQ
jgi:hypothetical protein